MGKVLQHPLTASFAVTILSALILKAADVITNKIGGIEIMKLFLQHFIVELWPIWIGLLIGGLYWFFRFMRTLYIGVKVIAPKAVESLCDSIKTTGKLVIDLQQSTQSAINHEAANRVAAIDGLSSRISRIESIISSPPPATRPPDPR